MKSIVSVYREVGKATKGILNAKTYKISHY
jgi:hypothetical protein